MSSPYRESNCDISNTSLARTENREEEKRNLLHPTKNFQDIYSPIRTVSVFTLLSQPDLQEKVELDHRNAEKVYSWKNIVGNNSQREKKNNEKSPWEML